MGYSKNTVRQKYVLKRKINIKIKIKIKINIKTTINASISWCGGTTSPDVGGPHTGMWGDHIRVEKTSIFWCGGTTSPDVGGPHPDVGSETAKTIDTMWGLGCGGGYIGGPHLRRALGGYTFWYHSFLFFSFASFPSKVEEGGIYDGDFLFIFVVIFLMCYHRKNANCFSHQSLAS